jgi:hypothetical protein
MAKKSIVKPKQREAEPEKKKAERVGFVEQMKNLLNSRWTYVFCSAILMFVFYVNYNEVYDKKPDLNGDNIIYYSLGKSLAEGNGYTDVISYNKMPHTHFPPGYPAFIATCLSLDSELDFEHFKKLNGVLLGLSVLMFFLILKRVTNNNLFVAFSASVLMCLQRELLRFSTIVMSEMLYLFLTMLVVYLAVVLYQKRSFKDYTWRSYVALVMFLLIISYIYFVRTMGLSMILGVIGWFGALAFCSFVKFYRDKRSGEESVLYKSKALYCLKMMALASLALFLAKGAWDIRNEEVGHTQSNYVSNFKKKERGEVMSSMSDWVARCKSNVKNYVGKLIPESVFVVDYEDNYVVTKTDFVLGVVLLALILIGLFRTGVGGFLIFSYLSLTFGVLLLYPEQFATMRYIVAAVPFVVFLYLNGIYNGLKFLAERAFLPQWIRSRSVAVSSVLLTLYALFWLAPLHTEAQAGARYYAKQPLEDVLDKSAQNYIAAAKWCKDSLPDTARLICRKPEIYYLYSGFKKSGNFPQYVPIDTFYNFLVEKKVTHVILDDWFKHAYITIYPVVKAYPDKFKVLRKIGESDSVKKENPTYVLRFNPEWGYVGDMVDGKKEGRGVETHQNGVRYEGEFKNNAANGYGVYVDPNRGVELKGIWKDGKLKDGEGTERYGDLIYKGKIKNSLPDGYGVCYDSTGAEKWKGVWSKGMLIKNSATAK